MSKPNVVVKPSSVVQPQSSVVSQSVEVQPPAPASPTPDPILAMQAELAKLRAENAALRSTERKLSLKVSEKGAVSVYGLGRFPVTLYPTQWAKLATAMEQVQSFCTANADELTKRQAANRESAKEA